MNRRYLAIGILALILMCAILSAGCARARRGGDEASPAPPALRTPPRPAQPTAIPAVPGAATCSAFGGNTCSPGMDCPGTWLEASDSFSCCSQACTGTGSTVIATIEPYETEVTNSGLGDIT